MLQHQAWPSSPLQVGKPNAGIETYTGHVCWNHVMAHLWHDGYFTLSVYTLHLANLIFTGARSFLNGVFLMLRISMHHYIMFFIHSLNQSDCKVGKHFLSVFFFSFFCTPIESVSANDAFERWTTTARGLITVLVKITRSTLYSSRYVTHLGLSVDYTFRLYWQLCITNKIWGNKFY